MGQETKHRALWLCASLGLVLLLLLSADVASAAKNCSDSTSGSPDPVQPIMDDQSPSVLQCAEQRCTTTTGSATLSTTSSPWMCETSEGTATCDTLYSAYNLYYSCILRANAALNPAPSPELQNETVAFLNAPGYPYHMSDIGCASLANFINVVTPSISTTCPSPTYEQCGSQSPDAYTLGEPGKGYNQVLCGYGCTAALLLTAFACMSGLMFCMCGIFWPSPSLKTTVARVRAEEEALLVREREVSEVDTEEDADAAADNGAQPREVQPEADEESL